MVYVHVLADYDEFVIEASSYICIAYIKKIIVWKKYLKIFHLFGDWSLNKCSSLHVITFYDYIYILEGLFPVKFGKLEHKQWTE